MWKNDLRSLYEATSRKLTHYSVVMVNQTNSLSINAGQGSCLLRVYDTAPVKW